MKLFLKDTVYKIFTYRDPGNSIYCIKLDDETCKKIQKFSKSKNIANYSYGIGFCKELNNDYMNCFKKYFIDNIQYEEFENYNQFIKSFYIDIPEEKLFYLKLKYPDIFTN